ncbi:hypothetical protein ACSBR2_014990 [Camellia fascicularis]
MCCANAESVDHLFLHFLVAFRVWGFVFSLFGIVWVQSRRVMDMLWCWRKARVGRRQWRVWYLVPFCLMWLVWLERNRCTFQEIHS